MLNVFKVIIGVGQDRNGDRIPGSVRESAIESIQTEAIELFGGFTITDSQGGWRDDNSRDVIEDGIVITLIVDTDKFNPDHTVRQFGRWAGRQLSQHSIVVIDPANGVHFHECLDGPTEGDNERHP